MAFDVIARDDAARALRGGPRRGARVACAGDSFKEFNHDGGPALIAALARGPLSIARAIHGGIEFWSCYDPNDVRQVPVYNAAPTSNTRNLVGLNHGVAGENSFGLLARADEIAGWKPDLVVAGIGSNDASQLVPLASYAANVAAFVDRLHASGIRTIFETVPPRAQSTDWSAGSQARALYYAYNSWIRSELVRRPGIAGILDVNALLLNPQSPTGNYAANMIAGDGRHLHHQGAWTIGAKLAQMLGAIFPGDPRRRVQAADDLYDAANNPGGNLLTGPQAVLMTGSGGSAGTAISGTMAGNFAGARQSGSTVTCAASLETDPVLGHSRQKLIFTVPGSGTGTETFAFWYSNAGDVAFQLPAGRAIRAGARMDASAYAGWKGINLQLKNQAQGFSAYDFYEAFGGYSGAGGLAPQAMGLWLETPPHTVASAGKADQWRWQVNVSIDATVAGAQTLAIGLPWLRCEADPRS